jgi:hypothetical protein
MIGIVAGGGRTDKPLMSTYQPFWRFFGRWRWVEENFIFFFLLLLEMDGLSMDLVLTMVSSPSYRGFSCEA